MSPGTMPQLCMGALLLLLPGFGGLVFGEIGDDFSHCLDFFYKQTPPEGVSTAGYQPICQRWRNQYHFATLYHRQHRTPLYSAYVLNPTDVKRFEEAWMYEPQLASAHASSEMKVLTMPVDQNVIDSQAVEADYEDSGYTRGHLNPKLHMGTEEGREATFTLTNIIPQREVSNSATWNRLENTVFGLSKNYCKESMYVITGFLPYKSGEHRINNRVSVPEYIWSAYCCPSPSAKVPTHEKKYFPTYAAVGRNDPNSGNEIVPVDVEKPPSVRGYDVERMSLETLEGILKERLNMPISLFHGLCK